MTSIVNVSPVQNIVAQVKWKCKVYSSMFSTVIIVHLLFSLLTFSSGSINSGGSMGYIEYQENIFTLDFVFIISIFMLCILGWSLATKLLKLQSYSVVTTSVSETISSLLFLVLLSGFTFLSALSTMYIIFFMKLLTNHEGVQYISASINPQVVILFYTIILLAGSVGYFLKSLFEFSKVVFSIVLVVFVLGVNKLQVDVYEFLFGESYVSVSSFSLLYIVILWGITIICRKQSEVVR